MCSLKKKSAGLVLNLHNATAAQGVCELSRVFLEMQVPVTSALPWFLASHSNITSKDLKWFFCQEQIYVQNVDIDQWRKVRRTSLCVIF